MSKRSTTGQPKPGQPKPEETSSKSRNQPKRLREYRSRHEREAEIQRYVVLGTAIAIALAVIILVGAVLNEQLLVPNQAVASVNGQTITVAQFKIRAKIERALLIQRLNSDISFMQAVGYTSDQITQALTNQQPDSTYYNELQIADQLGNSVVNTMIDDELTRQKAQELGITVSEADVDAQISKAIGNTPVSTGQETPTPSPTPTITPTPLVSPTPTLVPTASATPNLTTVTPTTTPFPSATPAPTLNATEEATQAQKTQNDFFDSIRTSAGVTDADIRNYFRAQALREKVSAAVITDVTHTAPFVDARHILVADQDTANRVLLALQNGESFANLAKADSTDGSASSGGELGWAPASNYVKEFADAVKTADIGALVGPIKSQFGYHIIQVRAREDRPLSDSDYQTAIANEYTNYLKTLRTAATTNVQVFDAWTNNVPTEPVFAPSF